MATKPDLHHTQYKWVWFDLDDTLWDFTNNSLAALGDLYRLEHLDRWWSDVDAWRDNYHRHNSELWAQYAPGLIDCATLRRERFRRPLRDVGVDDATALAMAPHLDTHYLRLLAQRPDTIEGAHRTLAALKDAGIYIGILSNGFNDTQQQKLRSAHLDRYIDLIVLSDDIAINKPDRRIYDYARRRAAALTGSDCPVEQTLMVGDNPETDILGALNAGWDAVWLNRASAPIPESLEACRDRGARLRVVGALDAVIRCLRIPVNPEDSGGDPR